MDDTPSARIREELRREILSGRLGPGTRLPTERQLAAHRGVSLTTINKVMTALELDGLLERRRGTGTYVRPDLAVRAVAVVLGPPHAPPGPRFWAELVRLLLDSMAARLGGVRTYLAAGTVPVEGTALARDLAAGRIEAALLLGAGASAAASVQEAGIPAVHLVGPGDGPAVRVAWRDATRDLADEMRRRGAWPAAVQLPPGWPGDEILAGYREAASGAGDEGLVGRAPEADGPAGAAWVGRMVARGVRAFLLAGERPEAALAALPADAAVAAWTLAGHVPHCPKELARLELDLQTLVQAGLETLGALERGEGPEALRQVRPRFIPGDTLP